MLPNSKDQRVARDFCARHNIPQPGFARFEDQAEALAYLTANYADRGVVIKADGLAAGKGVIVPIPAPRVRRR